MSLELNLESLIMISEFPEPCYIVDGLTGETINSTSVSWPGPASADSRW